MIPQCHRVDFLFRHEEEDIVTPIMENFCNGETGKEMTSRAAAGNHKLLGNSHDQIRGTERPMSTT